MSDVTIITNNHKREVLDAWQLTLSDRAEFDYLDWPAIERGEDSATFLRYRGRLYDLNDTEPGPGSSGMPAQLGGWDAYVSDSFFSGVVFRYVHDDDDYTVIAGRYYC